MKKLLCLVLAALICLTGFMFAFAEDGGAEGKIEKAKAIMASCLCIQAPEEVGDMLTIQARPTTYIIDRNGTVIGNPIVGANVEAYEARIMELLDGKTDKGEKSAEAEKPIEDKPSYTVTVVDQNGDPVPGASVGFCLDTGCVPVESDDNGVAVFHGAANRYHIKVVDAPDEYDYPDDTDIYIGPESGEATLTITKN